MEHYELPIPKWNEHFRTGEAGIVKLEEMGNWKIVEW